MNADQAKKSQYAQIELQDTAHHNGISHSSQRPQNEINEPSGKATATPEGQEKSPKQAKKVSFLSLLHFFFAVKLIRFINSLKEQKLSQEILEPVIPCETTQELEELFTKNYYDLKPKYAGKPQLIALILLRIFKKDVIIQVVWQLLFAASGILSPYFLYLTFNSLLDPAQPVGNAYAAAVGVFICLIVSTYATHQINFNSVFAVNRIKLGILAMLFRKINHISLLALQQFSLGKVINIAATDTDNLEGIHNVIAFALAPLILGGGIGLLCYFWGPSCFVGIGYMAFIAVLEDRIAWRSLPFGKKRDFHADERMRKTNEALEIIKVIKLETWEFSILNNIKKNRHIEASSLKKFFSVFFISRALVFSSSYIAAFLIFVTHNETEDDVSSDKIFPTILLLNSLGLNVTINAYLGSLQFVLMRGLFNHTISIMDLPEVQPLQKPIPPETPENSVEFKDFTGFWTKKDIEVPDFIKETPHPIPNKNGYVSDIPALSNINLNIKKGDLVIVAGQVASGKSSLLLSFTREMTKTSGELRYSGKFDYVPQEPIFLANSIKETITFGKPYDEELFWKVTEACCLTEMIQNLPKKEFTQVAERGANLSGSQKLQIALARSLYAQADIYLFDDPLSSLDSHLSKQVFKRAIQGFLKDATVILVTNHLNFVKHANHIVMMEAGKIVSQGTYNDLTRENSGSELVFELKERASYEKKGIHEYGAGRQFSDVFVFPLARGNKEKSEDETTHLQLTKKDDGLFIDEEKLDDGKPTMKIYWLYLRSIFKWWNIIPFIILFASCEAVGWQFMIRTSDWIQGEYSDSLAYGILAAIAFGNLILQFVKCVLFYSSGISAATYFHNKLLKSILQSPLKFFDRNGIGRIINRLANDLYMLDRFLLAALQEMIEGFCLFLINLIAVWTQEPYILIPAGVAAVFFVIIFLWCRKAIRQTRALDLTTKSPIYAQFSVLTTGLTVLRARDLTESVLRGFYKRADEHSKSNIAYQASIRLMSFMMDYVTALTVIAAFCIFIHDKESPVTLGPFINMIVLLPSTMQWILRNFITFYALMTSPARIINYCKNAQRVDFVRGNDTKYAKEGWPQKGEIEIHNASLRYRDQGNLVIKHLSAQFKAGEKIAILGHSGSGVTSFLRLMIRAFNLADKSTENSYIKIDHVDIDDVGARLLRRSMTFISQDYFLFTGTLRENMDPWKLYTDEEIWSALDTVELKHFVEQLNKKLDTFYIEGSSLFSVGQKQLFNIARLILRKSKILIQDRATSHVDIITDQHVQEKLKKRYKHATNLTTTTRLWNIADFDKILCIVDGEKEEFDEPYRLLVKEIGDQEITNKYGCFASLVIDMNRKITQEVFRIAMKKYYQTHNPLVTDVSLDRSIPNERLESEEIKSEGEKITPSVTTDQLKTSDIALPVNKKSKPALIEHLMLHELLPHILQKLRPAHLQSAIHYETD